MSQGDVVVDLYAGIGYFTIPFIKGGASHVHACEMNPNSIAALRRNLAANAAASSCTVCVQHTSHTRRSMPCSTCISLFLSHEGDNQVAARGLACVADRVSLGLLPTADAGVPLAVHVLRERGGCMHVHGNCSDSQQGIRCSSR